MSQHLGTTASPPSITAFEGESHWVAYSREYLIPAAVFAYMIYYLLVNVLGPIYEMGRPTRMPEVDIVPPHPSGPREEE